MSLFDGLEVAPEEQHEEPDKAVELSPPPSAFGFTAAPGEQKPPTTTSRKSAEVAQPPRQKQTQVEQPAPASTGGGFGSRLKKFFGKSKEDPKPTAVPESPKAAAKPAASPAPVQAPAVAAKKPAVSLKVEKKHGEEEKPKPEPKQEEPEPAEPKRKEPEATETKVGEKEPDKPKEAVAVEEKDQEVTKLEEKIEEKKVEIVPDPAPESNPEPPVVEPAPAPPAVVVVEEKPTPGKIAAKHVTDEEAIRAKFEKEWHALADGAKAAQKHREELSTATAKIKAELEKLERQQGAAIEKEAFEEAEAISGLIEEQQKLLAERELQFVDSKLADLEAHGTRIALLERQLEEERAAATEALGIAEENRKASTDLDQQCADLLKSIEEDLEKSTQQYVSERKKIEEQIEKADKDIEELVPSYKEAAKDRMALESSMTEQRARLEDEIAVLQEQLRKKQEEHKKCVEELDKSRQLSETEQSRLEQDRVMIKERKAALAKQLEELSKANSESVAIVESRQSEIAQAEAKRDEHSAAAKAISGHFERVSSANVTMEKLREVASKLVPLCKSSAESLAAKKAAILSTREKIKEAEREIASLAERVGTAQKEMSEIRRRISNAEASLPSLEESKKAFITAKNFKQAASVIQSIKEIADQKQHDERSLAAVTETLKTSAERQKEVASSRESLSAELISLRSSLDALLHGSPKLEIEPDERAALLAAEGVDSVIVQLLLDGGGEKH